MNIEVSNNWGWLDDRWLRLLYFGRLLGILSRWLPFLRLWSFTWGLGGFNLSGRLGHWHSWNVFAINEINGVGVDNTRVVVLGFDFEIVGYQVDGALRHEWVVWSERRWSESSALVTTATTSVSSSTIGTLSLVPLVVFPSRVLATTTTLIVLLLLLLLLLELTTVTVTTTAAATTISLAIVRLLVPGMLLVTARVGLWRVPRLRLAWMMETTFIVLLEVPVLLVLSLLLIVVLLVVRTLHCWFELGLEFKCS